jgi:hypothetical protein
MQPLSFQSTIARSLRYLAHAIGYASVPLLVLWALRTSRTALLDILWPRDADRRLIVLAFFLPLLLPAILNLIVPTRLTSLWTIPNWLLLPVVLLQSPLVRVTRAHAGRLLGAAVLFAVAILAAAPLIAAIVHRNGGDTKQAYYRALAQAAHAKWQEATTAPVRYLGGDHELARGAAFYLPGGAANASGLGDASVRAGGGIALLCDSMDDACIQRIETFRRPETRQSEVTITVSLCGWYPRSRRFVISIVPPVDSLASRE